VLTLLREVIDMVDSEVRDERMDGG